MQLVFTLLFLLDPNCAILFLHRNKQPKPVDLTEVLDFRSILECHHRNVELPQGVVVLQDKFSSPVFSLQNHPGNVFLGSCGLHVSRDLTNH